MSEKNSTTPPQVDLREGRGRDGFQSLSALPTGFWLKLTFVGALALFLGMGALQLFAVLVHPLALLVLAVSIAAAVAPLVGALERRFPRAAAILLVYFVIVFVFVGLGQLILPTLVAQAKKFGTAGPVLLDQAQANFGIFWGGTPLVSTLGPQLAQISTYLVSLPLMLISSLLEIFLILVMSIYWLLVAYPIRDFFLSLFPSSVDGEMGSMLKEIGRAMGGYVRATVINGIVVGTITAVGLTILGVDFPIVMGVIAGVLEFIPIIGPIISGVLITIVALLNSPTQALLALVLMFLVQQFEGNILVPNLMRRQTDLSPLLVILALIAGNTIGGLLGALIAIPIVSVIQVITIRILVPAIRRQVGTFSTDERTA